MCGHDAILRRLHSGKRLSKPSLEASDSATLPSTPLVLASLCSPQSEASDWF